MAMVVAHAAPATSIPSPATNTRSSTIFTAQETIKNSRDALLSPIPAGFPRHVISHIPESSEENNADIGVGELPRIIGHLHEPQNRRTGKLSDYRQWDGAQKQKGNGGCTDLLQAFHVTAPGKLRNENRYPGAKPQEHAQQDLHRLAAGAYGGQRYGTAEIADHQRIDGTIELLQHIPTQMGRQTAAPAS